MNSTATLSKMQIATGIQARAYQENTPQSRCTVQEIAREAKRILDKAAEQLATATAIHEKALRNNDIWQDACYHDAHRPSLREMQEDSSTCTLEEWTKSIVERVEKHKTKRARASFAQDEMQQPSQKTQRVAALLQKMMLERNLDAATPELMEEILGNLKKRQVIQQAQQASPKAPQAVEAEVPMEAEMQASPLARAEVQQASPKAVEAEVQQVDAEVQQVEAEVQQVEAEVQQMQQAPQASPLARAEVQQVEAEVQQASPLARAEMQVEAEASPKARAEEQQAPPPKGVEAEVQQAAPQLPEDDTLYFGVGGPDWSLIDSEQDDLTDDNASIDLLLEVYCNMITKKIQNEIKDAGAYCISNPGETIVMMLPPDNVRFIIQLTLPERNILKQAIAEFFSNNDRQLHKVDRTTAERIVEEIHEDSPDAEDILCVHRNAFKNALRIF